MRTEKQRAFKRKIKAARRRKIRYDLRHNGALFAMLAIPMAVLAVFQYVPLYGLQIAFKDYNPLGDMWSAPWVGLKYFKRFFGYYKFWDLVRNTVLLNLYDVALTGIPLLFALCLKYLPGKRFRTLVRNVAIMPHFISTVVVCSLVLRFLSTEGIINQLLGVFGHTPVNYLAHGENFRSIYVWSGVWQNAGYSAIIYIAALFGIPAEQQEAAEIDGANILQKIWYLDLPGVLPLFAVNLMMHCGALLSNNYEKVLLLQNNINLPYSQVISTYSYEVAFGGLIPQYSLVTAIGMVTAVLNLLMLLTVKKLTQGWETLDE